MHRDIRIYYEHHLRCGAPIHFLKCDEQRHCKLTLPRKPCAHEEKSSRAYHFYLHTVIKYVGSMHSMQTEQNKRSVIFKIKAFLYATILNDHSPKSGMT